MTIPLSIADCVYVYNNMHARLYVVQAFLFQLLHAEFVIDIAQLPLSS